MKFKDEFNNKMNLQKQLDALNKTKASGKFELLAKEGNPLMA